MDILGNPVEVPGDNPDNGFDEGIGIDLGYLRPTPLSGSRTFLPAICHISHIQAI